MDTTGGKSIVEGKLRKRYSPVREVTPEEQVGMVREIFSTITGRYDLLNRLLSLRRDVYWRRFTVRKMAFGPSRRLLDVATGTADLAIDGQGVVHVVFAI